MAKLNEKRKKKEKAKGYACFNAIYTSWLTCTHIIWKSKEPLVLGSLEEIPKEPAVLTKGQGQGVVREPAFSAAVIGLYVGNGSHILRSAAVIIQRNRRLF
jgi:hypothetical protein